VRPLNGLLKIAGCLEQLPQQLMGTQPILEEIEAELEITDDEATE
jgi:hypothetical protein